jgi:sulfate transport system substrate-binding protein
MNSAKRSTSTRWLNALGIVAAISAVAAVAWKNSQPAIGSVLIHLSYNSTQELFGDLNPKFVKTYERNSGIHVAVNQSDASNNADVVTFAMPSEVNELQRKGLIAEGWAGRLPGHSQPYTSTVVFVVRKGNPKAIHDWPDLVRKDVTVVTPDPRSSGNGKLSVLAAWGSVVRRGGSDASALAYLRQLYAHVPVPDAKARGAKETFSEDKVGDVLLTWENQALIERADSRGEYEIVYPPVSILAEPAVAWVDSAVARHHTEASAKAYLQYLFTAPAQEIIAKDGYRPVDAAVLAKYSKQFPPMNLFPVTAVAKDWDDASEKFFAAGGIFDQVRPVPVPPVSLAVAAPNRPI